LRAQELHPQVNTSNLATTNIDVTGPVKRITLVFGGTAGDYWISDITACSAGNFTSNYYDVSKPFTGQAAYVLHSFDKSVYAVNITTGFTRLLFTDAAGPGNINSMGYDPYRRILYYVYSLTASPGTNKVLKKYDFNTGTISTVLSDITSTTPGVGVGIPVTNYAGVESGAAAFYDGALYLGIETSNGSRNASREAVIWRIDFNAGNIPYQASQVFATPSDNGSGTLMHDWSDFAVNNGMLYDFDGAGVTTQTDVTHHDLVTGTTTIYALPSWTPGQNAIAWDNSIYQLYATTAGAGVAPYIALYNGTGGIGTQVTMTSSPMFTPAIPSLGDAAEAFRFPVDFGDALASYDPPGSDPGVNEISSNLYLGANKDSEMVTRGQTALANSDNYDDGLPTVSIFNPAYGNYLTQVNVFNNTGSNATVCAWLDFNGNGVFDASEGITVMVPNSASTQSVYLYWPSISSTLSFGTYSYLRIRVTSASNGMTTAKPTGYFNNGEIEDYRVAVNTFPLSVQLLSFDAQKTGDQKVNFQWQAAYEQANTKYELQRSSDMQNWASIQTIVITNPGNASHVYKYANPLSGISFYRLKTQDPNGSISYSQIKRIDFNNNVLIALAPNPAFNAVKLTVNNDKSSIAHLRIIDMSGKLVHDQNLIIQHGINSMTLSFVEKLKTGVYSVQLELDNKIYNEKLVVEK
jgi:hypothetical protein